MKKRTEKEKGMYRDDELRKFITVGLVAAIGYCIMGPVGLGLVALYYIVKG